MKKDVLPAQLSDADIIKEVTSGHTSMFAALVRRYNAPLYKTGRTYGYGHHDTQDLMQDTFIEAFLNLAAFESRSAFRTWLIRIMLNKCHGRHRKAAFKNEVNMEVDDAAVPAFSYSTYTDTNKLMMKKELNAVIEEALRQLPEPYSLVFAMRELNGLNVAETAEALNISETNVKVRLNRAKAMLRKEVEKSYSPDDIFEFNLVYCDTMVNTVMSNIVQLTNKPGTPYGACNN